MGGLHYPYNLELLGFMIGTGLVWFLVSALWTDPARRRRKPHSSSRGGR